MGLKEFDFILVFILPFFATTITIVARTDLLVSILLFFGFPAAYLTIRNPSSLKTSSLFALILSFPLSLCIDSIATINGSWIVTKSIFAYRIFGVATIEIYIFGFLWVFYVIVFYNHFLENQLRKDILSRRMAYLVGLSLLLILFAFIGFSFEIRLLHIPYFYDIVGIALVAIPLFLFLWIYPAFFRKFLIAGVYFVILLLLFEIAALSAGQWSFPGQDYAGFIQILGYRIPIEEIVIWILFATPALLSYYEYVRGDSSSEN